MLRSLPKGLKAGGRLFVSTPYLPGYLVPSRRALTTVGLSLEERKLELEARKLDTEERRWNEEKSREERRWKEELEERREARKEEERRWNEEKSREERRWKEEERRWNRQKFTETIIQKGWVVLIGGLFYWLGPSIVSKLYGSCLAQVPNIQQLKTKIEEEMVEARMNDAGQRPIDWGGGPPPP
ncbi:Golgin subfamily A member 6-like protein 22 [Balamuthia mandrillaris]